MADQRKRLPKSVTEHTEAHRDALAAIASGKDRTSDAVHAADIALRSAWAHAEATTKTGWSGDGVIYWSLIVADRLAETRKASGWTQAQLAEAMEPYGNWTRFTVAEIETGRRAVSLEELVLLAGLFAEPIASFLIPTRRTRLDLDSVQLTPEALSELLVGQGGIVGSGGAAWTVAAQVASEPARRPAPDLWAKRTGRERHTGRGQSNPRARAAKKDKK